MKKMLAMILVGILLLSTAVAIAEERSLSQIHQEYAEFLEGKWACTFSESMLQRTYGSGVKGEFTFNAKNLFVDASGCAYYYMTGPIVRILVNPKADNLLLIWGDTVMLQYNRAK